MPKALFRRRPSLVMRAAVAALSRGSSKQEMLDPEATMQGAARNVAEPDPIPTRLLRTTQVEHEQVGGPDGLQVSVLTRRGTTPTRDVLFLHGGGYVNPMTDHQWNLCGVMARQYDARVVVPHYRLAPEGTAETALADLAQVYDHYYRDRSAGPLVVGDSAGGGLAVAAARHVMATCAAPAPTHLGLIAPWLDVELAQPGIVETERRDPILSSPGLRHIGRQWAGELSTDDPRVSPLSGPVGDLPPVTLYVGDRDILLHEAVAFADKLRAAGIDTELHVAPGAFHAFVVAAFLPESRRAIKHLGQRAFGLD